jgi:hypothetical protein
MKKTNYSSDFLGTCGAKTRNGELRVRCENNIITDLNKTGLDNIKFIDSGRIGLMKVFFVTNS